MDRARAVDRPAPPAVDGSALPATGRPPFLTVERVRRLAADRLRWLKDRRAIAWFDRLVPVLPVAAALALYLPRLTSPPWYTLDEIVHAFTADEYQEGKAKAYR